MGKLDFPREFTFHCSRNPQKGLRAEDNTGQTCCASKDWRQEGQVETVSRDLLPL